MKRQRTRFSPWQFATEILETLCKRRYARASATIDEVHVNQDGPYTVATINKDVLGIAKFNPADRRRLVIRKSTTPRIRYVSKYSPEAGAKLAIYRAVEKLLDYTWPDESKYTMETTSNEETFADPEQILRDGPGLSPPCDMPSYPEDLTVHTDSLK